MNRLLLFGFACFGPISVHATPFSSCPTNAFLFQGKPVTAYSIDLSTGDFVNLANNFGSEFNATGFNQDDGYIYGVGNKKLKRTGSNYQLQALNIPNLGTVAAGDVFDGYYYFYDKNNSFIKRVDLSPLSSDPNAALSVETVMAFSQPIGDFVFNPEDSMIYTQEAFGGPLWRIDPNTQTIINLGSYNTGNFGAGYFDNDGNLFIGDNTSGNIFKVDVSDPNSIINPTLFVNGPSGSSNDGARCASAPLLDSNSTVDLGDAPDTYKTTLSANGPRHMMDGTTYLGTLVDADTDGQINSSDDANGSPDDEDGVGFVTAFELGLSTTISVEASTTGFLNAWIDWNSDGDFEDSGEKVFTDQVLNSGSNTLSLTTPSTASASQTWARFRFSQQTGLDYFGASTSGEVEDHQIVVTSNGEYVRHFPSSTTFATVAFEDFWSTKGDYDLNDVIMHYRITETLKHDEVIKSSIYGKLGAYGALFHNGFAIRLKGLNPSDIDMSTTRQLHNGVQLSDSGLESGLSNASFIISSDLTEVSGSNCDFYRTENGCPEAENFNFELHIETTLGADTSGLMAMPYDPFIIANTDSYHNNITPPSAGKRWEVHLPDHSPTGKFDTGLLALQDDDSNETLGKYFKTELNHPWALFITSEWDWPTERTDILSAYPTFQDYAESSGVSSLDWHQNPVSDTSKIYQKSGVSQ
ncbi:LruC domain-containing protein [Vibrio sagamiensis]|uniref:LruC domain-containing protein n=1 Tax=Vibrio sagamiensis NBRC 104589 TaxID=1219064 RepID=A0A511QDJ8_9VIBR|nr:LruC domain-containing protein [Vibrio sagamiensis]PNQ54346.1 LruC domain-containing protein [Vibrio agarivorans]GEM75381.1 LruC domain-containing protein [Vibrio sagamiensis NBRC 104589]